jgi:hypothetical protein
MVKRALACIKDPSNQDSQVFFSGEELAKAKCVTAQFKDLSEMKKHFNSHYLLSREPVVKNFWTLTRKILLPLGSLSSWHEPAEDFETTRKFYKEATASKK